MIDNINNAIAPPSVPPGHHPDIQLLRPGRLSIKCIGATDIERKGQRYAREKHVLNPALRFTLGSTSVKPLQLTSRTHHDTGACPSFDDEILSFNIQNPRDYFSENGTDVHIKIELLNNKNLLHSDLIGVIEMSVIRFLNSAAPQEEDIPIQLLGQMSLTTQASISLQFEFHVVKEGLLSVSLLDGPNLLSDAAAHPRQSSQIEVEFGSNIKQFQSLKLPDKKDQKKDNVYIMMNTENWFEDLILKQTCKGEDVPTSIRKQNIPLLSLIHNQYDEDKKDDEEGAIIPVSFQCTSIEDNEEKVRLGEATVGISFMQAGFITVRNISGVLFEQSSVLTNTGLQLSVMSKGVASTVEQKSKILRYEYPGKDIIWNEQLVLPVVDHTTLSVEIYELDALGTSQELVCCGKASLLEMYKYGNHTTSIKLECINEVGASIRCGELNFTLDFEGSGLSYPKLHRPIKSSPQKQKSPLAQEIVITSEIKADITSDSFSDDEIKSTFELVDLDKNSHIGAAELRHILVCMGELITEEEIDTMIEMLDLNGDGQVNFKQFYTMAKSPNFGFESISTVGDDNTKQSNINVEDDYKLKRSVFSRFVVNNKIPKGIINDFVEVLGQKRNALLSEVDSETPYCSIWETDYGSVCRYLRVECTGESRKVFDLLTPNHAGKIDARQLLLGLMSFISTYSVHEKSQILMQLYDINKSDFLTFEDLKQILAGNHLRPLKSVIRKAQTMMKFVDGAGTGKLTQEHLLDAARKFPNLLFPKHTQ